MQDFQETFSYILSFLLRDDPYYLNKVDYLTEEEILQKYPNLAESKGPYVIIVRSNFFSPQNYGTAQSLPPLPVPLLNQLPVLYGQARTQKIGHTFLVYADWVASTYFFVSRYEEMVCQDKRDLHGRFLGKKSWLGRSGYIQRPLVEEYGAVLRLWIDERVAEAPFQEEFEPKSPNSVLWERGFSKVFLTHDVDSPFLFRSWKGAVRSLLQKRSLKTTFLNKFSRLSYDPYYTFPQIERWDRGLKSTLSNCNKSIEVQDIYFFKSAGNTPLDKPHYHLSSSSLQQLRKFLVQRGSQIGLHASYQAGAEPDLLTKEKQKLDQHWGLSVNYNRHHFLRMRQPEDIHALIKAGITDDFTMAYADLAGFRLGTCCPVRAIDPSSGQLTSLIYHPLTCMECSLSDPKYMNLNYEEALVYAKNLIRQVYLHGGELCLLWHNSSFIPNVYRYQDLYPCLCAYISELEGQTYQIPLRIFIVCDFFPPNFAPRMGYLAKYLTEAGHQVEVLTEKVQDIGTFEQLKEGISVQYISSYKPSKNTPLKSFSCLLGSYMGPKRKSKLFFKAGRQILENQAFDLIVSSSYRDFPLGVASRLHRCFDIPWIADIRDMVEQYPGNEFISRKLPSLFGLEKLLAQFWKNYQIQIRQYHIQSSAAVTTVSPWHQKLGKLQHRNIPWCLIYNGFNPDSYLLEAQISSVFRIVYTGRIISQDYQDPHLLFEALSCGLKQEEEWAQSTQIEWYIDEKSKKIVERIAFPYALDSHIQYKKLVPFEQVPTVLNKSSVVLVLINERAPGFSKECPGTKLFEAMGAQKPILCVQCKSGEVARIIQESGHGCTATEVEEVMVFLRCCYQEWKNKGYTQIKGQDDKLKIYHRTYQAQQYQALFDQVLHNASVASTPKSLKINKSIAPVLQIVAFNQPYPPNYGGVIDVFYKLQALHQQGVHIILHTFVYGRPYAQELHHYCKQVYYYDRKTTWKSQVSYLPYSVYSRRSTSLLDRLASCPAPILFEGLHSCYCLASPRLKDHFKIYRESNIEHHYYTHLCRAEPQCLRKAYYGIEALKFRYFQRVLRHTQWMLAVSPSDTSYLKEHFPQNSVEWMPSFHPYQDLKPVEGVAKTPYLLYHGNLSVPENEQAALYLIEHLFAFLGQYSCVIAGLNPSSRLRKAVEKYSHIQLVDSPSEEEMNRWVAQAQIHLLYTAQATGLKLKLLHCLSTSAHVVVNPLMVQGSGLESLCHVCESKQDWINLCKKGMQFPLGEEEKVQRKEKFFQICSNHRGAQRIIEILK